MMCPNTLLMISLKRIILEAFAGWEDIGKKLICTIWE